MHTVCEPGVMRDVYESLVEQGFTVHAYSSYVQDDRGDRNRPLEFVAGELALVYTQEDMADGFTVALQRCGLDAIAPYHPPEILFGRPKVEEGAPRVTGKYVIRYASKDRGVWGLVLQHSKRTFP